MTQQIEELLSSLGSGSLKEQHQTRMNIIELGSNNGTLPNYGLKADTNREKVNKAVRELLSLGKANSDYTESELELLRQYSGQGGLKQNSQYEYYTPTKIAAGMWDALKLHGYSGGNFLEPSVGAGVYLATKPENSIGTAVEIDPTSSKVAQILNPGDSVTNQSFEELCINTPAGIYDAAIGNVPFGDVRGKWANKDKAHKHISDIEIYFLLRMADKVRPGGLIAVVVPSRVVSNKDKKWQAFRAEMSMKAEFLGAHRMPSKEFAKQGATVITDVVIFKKHAKEITGFPNETLENAKVLWDTFIGGHWFEKDGKRYVHGDFVPKEVGDRYGRDQVISATPFDAKKLAVKFDSRIDWDLLQINPEDMPVYVTGDKRIINGDMHVFTGQEWMKAELTEAEKEAKNIFAQPIEALKSNKSIAELFEMRGLLPKNIQDAMDYAMKQKIQYRDAVFRGILMGMAIENAETNQVGQGDINQMVLDEVALHGNPHNIKGLSTFSGASRDFGRYMGMIDPNTGDIRTKTVSERVENFNRDNPQSIVIFLSENGESVNLEQLNDLYSGSPLSLQDIAKMPNLAITPDGKIMELEAYCSGDAVRKSLDINLALADETDPDIRAAYYRQLERIEAKREYAKLENINLTLQTAWLDSKYMSEFLRSIGYSYAKPGDGSQLRPLEGWYGADGFEKWLINRLSGKPTSGGSRNQEYLDRFAGLNDRFADFMRSHADAKDVETDYNNLFLSEIPQTFSESPLGLENVIVKPAPHKYQNAAVRRLSAQGGGLLSLDVGLGKTKCALLLHEFDKKMKRTSRTCITVPDNVLVNWFREHEQTYVDGSKTLFVGLSVSDEKEPVLDGDGNPTGKMQYVVKKASKDVFKQLHTIPTSAYDLVIMSNEVFQRIPIKTETIEQQAGIMKDDNRLTDKEKISYAEAVEKNRKEQQATDEGTNKKAEWPFFEDLGFTKVISDEMHSYKNSYTVSGKLSRLAYLPTPKPSQRSLDMAIKSGYIRHKFGGKGVIGLTATPIVNSPLEVYSMLSLVVDPQEFRRLGIFSPDDFVNQFARIGTVEKLRVNNTIDLVDGVTGFRDLQSLRALFKKYAISLDAEDVGLELPDADRQEIAVDLDDEQEVEYDLLLDEYKEMREANDKTLVRSIFSIIRDMERVTMGVDVFKRQIRFVFGHDVDIDTIRKAVESLPKSAKAGDGDDDYLKGEDVDVSLKFNVQAQDNGTIVTLPDAFEKPFVAALKKLKVEESSFTHPISPKIAALLERVAAELAIKSKQIIFTEEVAAHSQLRRIIGKSLPITLGKVGIINAKEADSTKIQEISDNYNTGSMLIVIANRKAEVGVNLQVGTGAIHHYDYPWTPAAMKQRNGRGLRQGNKSKAVRIYCYKANGTFDQYRLNLLAVKDEILSSVMEGSEAEAENQDSAKFSADDLEILTSKNPEEAKAKMEAARNKAYAAKKAKDDYAARMALGRIMQIRAKKAEFVLQYGQSAAGAPKYEAKLAEFDKKAATEIDYLTERDKQGKNPFDVKAALADQGTFVAGNVVLIPGCFYRIKEPSIPGTPKIIHELSQNDDFKFTGANNYKSYTQVYTALNFISLQSSVIGYEFKSTAIHDIVFEQTFPDVLGEELNKYKQNPVTNDDYQKLSDELFDKLKGVATLANCAVFYNEDGQLKAKMFSGVMPDNAVRMFGGIKSRRDGSAEDRDRQFARWYFKEGSSMPYDKGGLPYKMMEQYFGYRYEDYFKTLLNCIDEPGTTKVIVDYINNLQITYEQTQSTKVNDDLLPHIDAVIELIQKDFDNSRSELSYWVKNTIGSLYMAKSAAIVKASRSTSLRDLLADPKVKLPDNIVKAFADIGVMVFVNPVTIGKTEEWKSIFMLFNNDNVFANHFGNDYKSDIAREEGSKSDNAVIGMWPFSDYDRYYQFNKPVNIVNLGLVYKRMVGTTIGKAGDKAVADTKAKAKREVPEEGMVNALQFLRNNVVDWQSSKKYRGRNATNEQKYEWDNELSIELDEWLIRYAPVDWQTNKDRLKGVMRKIREYGSISHYAIERVTDAFASYPRYK